MGIVFALAPSLHSFWSYFSTGFQSHIGHLLPWGVPLSVSYHFAFSYYPWGSQGKNTEVVCHSFLKWTTFCQSSPPLPAHLGWPHRGWLRFIELDKSVVLVWLDWLVFCDYVFSVSAPSCPLAKSTILRLVQANCWVGCVTGSLATEPWYSQVSAQTLMGRVGSWALWCEQWYPKVAVGSGALKVACLWEDGVVSLPS